MEIKDIIESLNKLAEEAEHMGEEVLQDIPAEEPEVQPAFNDGMSLADTLDAKAKIAKALENLKEAVEEFKDATAEKVDLIKDNVLIQQIEGLDQVIAGIEAILAEGILMPSELNDPFKAELPNEEAVANEEPVEEKAEEETEEEIEEDDEIRDFENEAGFDLLGEN